MPSLMGSAKDTRGPEVKPNGAILVAQAIGGVTQKIYYTNSHDVTMSLPLVMGLANSSIETSIESLLS